MKAKYSRRVREEAALICAIAASGGVFAEWRRGLEVLYAPIRFALGASVHAMELAIKAWRVARNDHEHRSWTRETDAEAEALIRTGWSP